MCVFLLTRPFIFLLQGGTPGDVVVGSLDDGLDLFPRPAVIIPRTSHVSPPLYIMVPF